MGDVLVDSPSLGYSGEGHQGKKKKYTKENDSAKTDESDRKKVPKGGSKHSPKRSPTKAFRSPSKKSRKSAAEATKENGRPEEEGTAASDEELSREDIDKLYRMEVQALYQEFPGLSDKYHIIETLGEGTFSCVYRAYSLEHQCDVALKRIFPMSSPKRVANELHLLHLAGGQHNVARVLEGIRHRDTVILVLDHFEHDEFRSYYKRFSVEKLQKYLYALFESLAHIHDLHILHRDVKPSNFLYDFDNDRGLLVDFGLAQLLDNDPTDPRTSTTSTTATTGFPSSISLSAAKTTAASNGSDVSPSPFRSPPKSQWPPSKAVSSITPSPKPPPRSILEREMALLQSHPPSLKKASATAAAVTSGVSSLISIPNPPFFKKITAMAAAHMMKAPAKPAGVLLNDKRVPLRATRAGTRGFRAPEVLLKSKVQSTAIDVWSAGVILLSILTRRYPFFQSPDDLSALAEIVVLTGREAMRQCALLLQRRLLIDEKAFPNEPPMTLRDLCCSLAPDWNDMLPDSLYDLLERCLALNPHERISAREALQHEFFSTHTPASSLHN